MMELTALTERTYYFNSPAKVGLFLLDDTRAVLVDSGNDRQAGKRILRTLNERGWQLYGIINTHFHADHCGGNAYLQEQTGCRIFAPHGEDALIETPLLEPTLLFGAYPPPALRNKFLMAEPSRICPLDDATFPSELTVVPLPGHTAGMIGVQTPDGVLFAADAVSSPTILEKYGLTYLYDVGTYRRTLRELAAYSAEWFVPSHTEPTQDIVPLITANEEAVQAGIQTVCGLLSHPQTADELIRAVFQAYGLTMTVEQYALVGSTVRSYLAYLAEEKAVTAAVEDNRLLWCRTE